MSDNPSTTTITTDTAVDHAPIVDRYFAVWNEDDLERRRALVEQAFTPEATYADPLAAVEGHGGINAMVEALRAQHPGYSLRLASAIDQHHGRLRFEWEIVNPEGDLYLEGLDVAVVAEDGRLHSITGFFGAIPEKEAG
jgi:hypothetical protein